MEPRSVTYDKVRALARTRREKHNLIKISPLNGRVKNPRLKAFEQNFVQLRTTKYAPSQKPAKNPKNKWGPRGILCTRGGKEHTSKRVSIVAYENAISKVKCATHYRR